MKKILCTCACLMLLLCACNSNNNNNNSTSQTPVPESSIVEEDNNITDEIPDTNEMPEPVELSDENVTVTLEMDRNNYTHENELTATVTITNESDTTIAFVKGSGSNIIPDSLHVSLGSLAPMFRPEVATMDYQMEKLEPGESVTYTLRFAPFIPLDPDAFGYGIDIGLDYFRDDEERFTPADAGEVEGTIRFTYAVTTSEDPDTIFEGLTDDDNITLEKQFHTEII